MAQNDDDIVIGLDSSAFEEGAKRSEEAAKKFGEQASKSFKTVQDAFSTMAGNLAANGVAKALGFVKDSINEVINEAAQSEKNVSDLNIALKQAGLGSEETSKRFQDLAQSISDVTTVDDDLILGVTATLANLTSLSKDGLEEATKRAVDLSQSLGIDLNTATEMVTKAINGQTTAFTKRGIEIKKGNTDQERLNNLLLATEQFAGGAAEKTNTYSGALEQQNNAYGNLLATIGSFYTTNENTVKSIQNTTSIYQSLNKTLEDNRQNINDFIESLKISIPIIAAIGAGVLATTVSFTGLATAAASAWAAITGPIGLAVIGITAVVSATYALYRNFDLVQAAAYNAMAATLEYSAKAMGIFSEKNAKAIGDQAQAYREKAAALRENKDLEEDLVALEALLNEESDTGTRNQVINQKTKQEMLAQTADLQKQLRLEAEVQRISDDAYELQRTDEKFKKLVADLGLEAAIRREAEMNITTDKIEQEKLRLQTEIDINKEKVKRQDEMRKKVKDAEKEHYDRMREGGIAFKTWEEQTDQEKLATTKETLGGISSLTRNSNNELFEIGKAASIAQATMDGYLAAQKALASLPPPWNFAAAALVGVATAANVANIANQPRPKFAGSGILPGSQMTGDQQLYMGNAGEMVLNKNDQAYMFNELKTRGFGNNDAVIGLLTRIATSLETLRFNLNIDGKVIFDVVRDQLSLGRSF